jgi:two-component system, sensor histidine kinase
MLSRTRILIVEDEELLVVELQELLARFGYEVVGSASTGAAAIELAVRHAPDLVLMDIRLDGPLDGIEAAAAINAVRATPVVFLTAHSDDDTFARASGEGAPFGFLVKPLCPRELRMGLAMALRKAAILEDLRRTNAALEKRNQALQDFTANASHDLRAPLATIRYALELLRDDGQLSPSQAELIAALDATSVRMFSLLDGLLDLVQLEAPLKSDVDLRETMMGVVADLRQAIAESGAQVSVGPMPTLHGDPVQLHRLFLNVVGNAIKYRRDGATPAVDIRAVDENDSLRIDVADNGIGLPEGYESRLFQPFQRLEGSESYPGTGLGLAACAKIADSHQATISAASRAPHGTCFSIRFAKAPAWDVVLAS